jgi:NADH:ubiquinone oxidoreductase subunit F (NADH-binding)
MSAAARSSRAPSAAPAGVPRLLAGIHRDGSAVGLREHLERWGAPPVRAPIADLVEASGLLGRGGAGFPTAVKLRSVAAGRGRTIVVANGAEGEPASGKDKLLLRCLPHVVLDGIALAAAAVGAEAAVVTVASNARAELKSVAEALAERRRARLDRVAVRLVAVPDTFVAGEETALVNFLNGRAAKPTFVPPRPFERGVRGRPTLVQNVETLANIALVARFGPEWFRGLGTRDEPGSVLVTVSGIAARPVVFEVALGTPLRDVLLGAGRLCEKPAAVLVGGYFGSWVTAAEAGRLALLDADLRTVGASLGARVLAALPAGACGVAESARVARYLADESAGQCGPCVNGLAAIAGALERIARGDARHLDRLDRWLGQVAGRGACVHPDGAVRFVASARRVFAAEFDRHAGGRCTGRGRPTLYLGDER